MPFFLKLLLWLLGLGVSLYAIACVFLVLQQTRMIFFPTARIEMTPAPLDHKDVWLNTATQERIHGWWIPASQPNAPVLLYLHGNGENIGANAEHASRFQRLGLSVLIIDYRGYGQSTGEFPSESRVYEDAETAWNYLTKTQGIPPERIFIYGHSLGGAIAIQLASRSGDSAAGLIVESSFTSIRQMIDRTSTYRVFPIDLLLTQRFESIEKVPQLKMPVLFIHGLADVQIPFAMSQALYQATPEPKQIYLVPGAGHNNTASTGGEEYLDVVKKFLRQAETRRK
jgi:uncharacterized protein